MPQFFYSQATSTDLLLKLKLGPRSFLRGGDPRRTLCHRNSSVFNWFARWEEDVEVDVGDGEGVEMEELGLGEEQHGDGGTMSGSWLCGTLTLRSESWVVGSFGSFKQISAATLDIFIVDRKKSSPSTLTIPKAGLLSLRTFTLNDVAVQEILTRRSSDSDSRRSTTNELATSPATWV